MTRIVCEYRMDGLVGLPKTVNRSRHPFAPVRVWWISKQDGDGWRTEVTLIGADSGLNATLYAEHDPIPSWVPRPPAWFPLADNIARETAAAVSGARS